MPKATVSIDVRTLRPVVEALIFASEEPLPPRVLVRLLAGERDDSRTSPGDPDAVGDSGGDTPTDSSSDDTLGDDAGASGRATGEADSSDETSFSEEAVVDAAASGIRTGSNGGGASRNGSGAVEGWREE